MRLLTLAAVALAALTVAGCGGGGSASPEDTVSTAISALAKGDAKKVCDQFSADGQSKLLVVLRTGPVGLPKIKATSCDEAVTKIYTALPKAIRDVLTDGKVDKAKISGDSAEVHVAGAGVTADLAKVDGDWKITGGLFG